MPAVSPRIFAAVSAAQPDRAIKVGASRSASSLISASRASISMVSCRHRSVTAVARRATVPDRAARRALIRLRLLARSRDRAGRVPVGVEFVQVPAQPVDRSGAFGQEVLAVVDQEPQVTVGSVQMGDGEVVLAQGGAGDG